MPNGKPTFTNIKDKKISIYRRKDEKDDYGEPIDAWEPISDKKLWACYRSVSGNQFAAALTAGFTEDCSFTVNWRDDLVPGLHVVYRGKVLEVVRADDLEGYKGDIKLGCKIVQGATVESYSEV